MLANLTTMSSVLFQKLFCLVDFGGQKWAASSIWMVEEHQLSVVLADFLFR
jgi:hypothetical protein